MKPNTVVLTIVAAGMLAGAGCATSEPNSRKHFSDWPDGAEPAEVGIRVAENFLPRKFRYETNAAKASLGVIYPEACAWYGSLTVSDLVDNDTLTDALVRKFDRFLTPEGDKHINRRAHVDYRVVGIVPLQIYLENGEKPYLDLGLSLADAQWENPTPDGITSEARYWIDDMYMIPAVQAQAFRATGDSKYLERAALAMVAYLDKLQQPNGLFFHGQDSPFYWGRGNGWVAAGMSELLRSLPPDHPQRPIIMQGYRRMMAALLEAQDENGMWHQLVDKSYSWPETSGSAMFTFAFVTGVKEGWLASDVYGPAARRAWIALTGYLDENARLREVCIGTNKADNEQFYLDRPRAVGDLHGQAPMLWTASALLR